MLLSSILDGASRGPIWSIPLAVLSILLFSRIIAALQDPLRDQPGPLLARFTRLWLFWQYTRGDYHKTNLDLHNKYGPVVRIAPGQYSIDNPEAAKIIYGHGSRFVKTDWYLPWGHPVERNLFNETDPRAHANLRRQVANVYSMSSMVSYEPYVDECTDILCRRFSEFSATSQPVDLARWFQCYAFDMIGKITFSRRFGFLDAGEDLGGIMKVLDAAAQLSSAIGVYSFVFPYLMSLAEHLSSSKEAKGPAVIAEYAAEQVEARRNEEKTHDGPQDFVTKLLQAQKERPEAVTDDAIRLSSAANIAAGSDTTSIALSAIMYNLCKHPVVLDELRRELENSEATGSISSPITFREAQGLPYLQAVIKESLRLHPATGFTMPRLVPQGGKHLAGSYFPDKTIVGINSWVAHQNRDVFGHDAMEFRPERWLDSKRISNEETNRMEAYFFSFGQGSRTCIGKNISLLEISKAIPRLVKNFDFQLENIDNWHCANYWFVKPTNFRCIVKKRGA